MGRKAGTKESRRDSEVFEGGTGSFAWRQQKMLRYGYSGVQRLAKKMAGEVYARPEPILSASAITNDEGREYLVLWFP